MLEVYIGSSEDRIIVATHQGGDVLIRERILSTTDINWISQVTEVRKLIRHDLTDVIVYATHSLTLQAFRCYGYKTIHLSRKSLIAKHLKKLARNITCTRTYSTWDFPCLRPFNPKFYLDSCICGRGRDNRIRFCLTLTTVDLKHKHVSVGIGEENLASILRYLTYEYSNIIYINKGYIYLNNKLYVQYFPAESGEPLHSVPLTYSQEDVVGFMNQHL